jgi:hypothetical protein
MAMPRAKTNAQVAGNQRLKVVDVFSTNREVIRFWDKAVPISGQKMSGRLGLFR